MRANLRRVLLYAVLLSVVVVSRFGDAATPLPKVRVVADGAVFQTAEGKPFVPIGVNYFRPRTGWAPQLWKQFDAEATRRDFHVMRELGVTCVRVFLTYGSFYTESGKLNPDGLRKLDQLLAIAEESGIYVHPTGPDHWEGLPEWAKGDRMSDEHVQTLGDFWRQLAARYRGRSVLFAYDLLNEPSVPWTSESLSSKWNPWLDAKYHSADAVAKAWNVPRDEIQWGRELAPPARAGEHPARLLDYQRFRESIADFWTREQVKAIKQGDPDALVTVGCIQWSVPVVLPGIQHYAAFRPERQAPLLDFLEIHFYPLATGFYEYAPDAERKNLEYLQSVVREVAACGKPVVVAEFGWYGGGTLTIDGGKHRAASEEDQARWCRLAIESTEGLATGWLNWGLYDHPEARDVTQLTGLLTVDGRPKAWAREFSRLAARFSKEVPPRRAASDLPKLDWDRRLVH